MQCASADLDLLREHDDLAYAEAERVGGLLFYFKGLVNERGECLSFCVWESSKQARRAAGAPSHGEVATISAKIYESFTLERYNLVNLAKQGGDKTLAFRRREAAALPGARPASRPETRPDARMRKGASLRSGYSWTGSPV